MKVCYWVVCLLIVFANVVSCEKNNSDENRSQDAGKNASAQGAQVAALEQDKADGSVNWPGYGRTAAEQRHSPLNKISTENVDQLGVAWVTGLETYRGIEATPVVIDGVMYTTGSWGVTFALNAKTGAVLWKYDPEVPKWKAAHACCDVNNRGVAVHGDKVFVGAFDGRLIALNRSSGKLEWSTQTFDIKLPYSITGAPRVVKDKVIIGNGGAEYGVRGFVAAYDVDTGERAWQFFTVPGNPADGFESDLMKMAAETWTGEWWAQGGGGTVWDSMAYDAELDLLYIGVGNGAPWNQKVRSPGGGDNLFLSSIVALRPDTGEYVWHYQTTPGDTWDFTATQSIILAELEIEGELRKVLLQAPKNGFFYVLDRENGKLISADNYVTTTWATGVDLETGRPTEAANARYPDGEMALLFPGPFGGHNWHPMSYNPDLGIAFIPAQDSPFPYIDYIGEELARVDQDAMNTNVLMAFANLPDSQVERDAMLKAATKGHLSAWDPVQKKELWRVQYTRTGNGGTLSTAGNLVFQGNHKQEFTAVDARNGQLLWTEQLNGEASGGAVSYEVDGEQYIAISAGWGGILHLYIGALVGPRSEPLEGMVIAFKLGGDVTLDLDIAPLPPVPEPPVETASAAEIEHGRQVYNRFCTSCHGDSVIGSGETPDLRYSQTLGNEAFNAIVNGAMATTAMPDFTGRLSTSELTDVHAYIINRAWPGYLDDQAIASQDTLVQE